MSTLSTNAAILAFSTAIGTTCPNTPPTPNNSYGTLEMEIHLGNGKGGTIALDGITFTNNNVTSATNTVTRATQPMIRQIMRWVDNISRGKKDIRQSMIKATFVEAGSIGPAPGKR